jgi:hypothetical protein
MTRLLGMSYLSVVDNAGQVKLFPFGNSQTIIGRYFTPPALGEAPTTSVALRLLTTSQWRMMKKTIIWWSETRT